MAFSEKQIREGRARLAEALKGAREEARASMQDHDTSLQTGTTLGHTLFSRLKEENLDALIVHRGVKGWYADILLKDMPAGLPVVFGTPSKMPHSNRALAEADGKMMLVTAFRAILERETISRDTHVEDIRPFELYGVTYRIPGELVDQLQPMVDSLPEDFVGTRESVTERLLSLVSRHIDDENNLDPGAVNSLPEQDRMAMLANMATLLCMGVFRLPDRTPEPIPEENFPQMN